MNIQEIPINKISPDPKQPRKFLDKERIKQLSVSIRNKGVINPIEIDKKFVIITGEMRWQASKLAGLEKVPCKVFDINPDQRFLRQMHENIHQRTMTDWDIAEGLKKSADILKRLHPERFAPDKSHPYSEMICTVLQQEYGKTPSWMSHHLLLLKEKGRIRDALKKGRIGYNKVDMIRACNPRDRKFIEKLAFDESINKDSLREIYRSLKVFPEKVKQINWSGKSFPEIISITRSFNISRFESASDVAKDIQKRIIELIEILEKYHISYFGSLSTILVIPYIMKLGQFLGNYIVKAKEITKVDNIKTLK